MVDGKLKTVLGMDHTENVVCPGCCVQQQQEPRALKIGHLRDPVQEDSTFLDLFGQLPFDEFCATQRSAKNCDPLLVTGESRVSSPHTHRSVCHQLCGTIRNQEEAFLRTCSTLESCPGSPGSWRGTTIGSPPTVPPWPLGLAAS